jgi:mono/diheme cytochrome c family protein
LRSTIRNWTCVIATVTLLTMAISAYPAAAQTFHNAPASAGQMKNPYAGNARAAAGGKKLFAQNCAQCHGSDLKGMGPAPSLTSAKVKATSPGEIFWFITNGDLNKGMPGWAQLPKPQRWQIITFLESKNGAQ